MAERYGVVWVEREFSEGITENLPDALPHGIAIYTEGPRNEFNTLGCRAIFIVGEPPMRDIHGKNMEIWTRATVRIPSELKGEHVWKFRTINCQPWTVVESSQYVAQGSVSAPSPKSGTTLALLESDLKNKFPNDDILCEGEIINSSEMVACEVSDLNQFMSLIGVYDVTTGAVLHVYLGSYVYDGGVMSICQGESFQDTECTWDHGVTTIEFVRQMGLQKQLTAELLAE